MKSYQKEFISKITYYYESGWRIAEDWPCCWQEEAANLGLIVLRTENDRNPPTRRRGRRALGAGRRRCRCSPPTAECVTLASASTNRKWEYTTQQPRAPSQWSPASYIQESAFEFDKQIKWIISLMVLMKSIEIFLWFFWIDRIRFFYDSEFFEGLVRIVTRLLNDLILFDFRKTDRSGSVVFSSEYSVRNEEGRSDHTNQTASEVNRKGIHGIINY